jgi:hypothetical protein
MVLSWDNHPTIILKEMVWKNQLTKHLIQILKKTIATNHKNWHKKLTYALWVSHLTPKDSTGHSPYTLVYGKEARMLLHMELNALVITTNNEDMEKISPLQKQYHELMLLEEQEYKQ